MFYTILKTDDLESLNLYEEQFIKILRATDRNFGYNIRPGGANSKLSEEHKRKIGLAGIGRRQTEANKKATSERSKGNTWASVTKGKIVTEESKKKMSESAILRGNDNLKKPCMVYRDNGTFVGEFESRLEASEFMNISYGHFKRLRRTNKIIIK
jgi:hypothetical protein